MKSEEKEVVWKDDPFLARTDLFIVGVVGNEDEELVVLLSVDVLLSLPLLLVGGSVM